MAIDLSSEQFGKVLSFETWNGARYINLLFTQLLDPQTAQQLGVDIIALHQQHLPSFAHTGIVGWRDYSYASFYDVNGNRVILGVPWVKGDSITDNANPTYTLTLPNATHEQVDSLMSMATANGIENVILTRS